MKRILKTVSKRFKWNVIKPTNGKGIIVQMNSNDMNLIGDQFVSDFHESLDEIQANYSKEPVILTSSQEDVFSMGMEREWFENLPENGKVICDNLNGLFERLYTFEQPTIAAINGDAFSSGFIVALACDVRFMDYKHKVGLRAPSIGLPFPSAIYKIAMNELPHRLQKRFLYLGDEITGEMAVSEGVCFRHLKNSLEDALDFANAIVSVETFVSNKNAMKSGFEKWMSQEGKEIDENFVECSKSEQFQESLQEYLSQLTLTVLDREIQPHQFNY